ncbi:hypothetical protein [Pseudomonas guariconensis]|uniref:hypothetical protein n=1 Tax=Pseudomonas guariconensis TaxID=1288410 RepID=UPI0039058C84
MSKHDVQDVGGALAYLTDCTLATVDQLAMKKSASKSELQRQIGIAQSGIDWMKRFGVDYAKTRARQVDEFGGSVAVWAERRCEPQENATK